MDFQPFNGILEADSTEVMGITIRSAGFDPDIWEGEIVFNHNALGGEAILPVTMTIVESAVNNHQNNLPSESGITSVYPNPFNSIATIRFDLNVETVVSLRLFDISGREIRTLIENEAQEIGQHSIVLNADNLPAGLYLLKLEADRDFSVRKIVLMP
ncbi:T9SS type A sorting domain-containing protein, partial [bacterium]|nr:T9SS type A sorting domain-containing protein [bacterium]